MFDDIPHNFPKVTFGFVNCNRLHYLKSCVESLLFCTKAYPNLEFIVIDNASIEDGTGEYLDNLANQGFKVFITESRDPANEYAKALNKIFEESTGEFICPLTGDMQFILDGDWLKEYVFLYEKNVKNIGCIIFDAQRQITNSRHTFSDAVKSPEGYGFVIDASRPPLAAAGNAMYHRTVLEKIYPWSTKNTNHEGGPDSESELLDRVKSMRTNGLVNWCTAAPIISPSAAIYTDPRGTMARVRGNRRYGDYWPPKDSFKYYEINDYSNMCKKFAKENTPIGIEKLANPIGWSKPLDSDGVWLKNPIDPNNASPSDYVVLHEPIVQEKVVEAEEAYLDDWLDS